MAKTAFVVIGLERFGLNAQSKFNSYISGDLK